MSARAARATAKAAGGGDIDAFRAQLMRQFSGASVEREISSVREATSLAPGQILVANPARFCSRNPFSRAVQDLERFGLSGPVSDDNMPPDMRASMLPVLALRVAPGSRCLDVCASPGSKTSQLLEALHRRGGGGGHLGGVHVLRRRGGVPADGGAPERLVHGRPRRRRAWRRMSPPGAGACFAAEGGFTGVRGVDSRWNCVFSHGRD